MIGVFAVSALAAVVLVLLSHLQLKKRLTVLREAHAHISRQQADTNAQLGELKALLAPAIAQLPKTRSKRAN